MYKFTKILLNKNRKRKQEKLDKAICPRCQNNKFCHKCKESLEGKLFKNFSITSMRTHSICRDCSLKEAVT